MGGGAVAAGRGVQPLLGRQDLGADVPQERHDRARDAPPRRQGRLQRSSAPKRPRPSVPPSWPNFCFWGTPRDPIPCPWDDVTWQDMTGDGSRKTACRWTCRACDAGATATARLQAASPDPLPTSARSRSSIVAASRFTNGIVQTPVTRVFWTFARKRIALRARPCRAQYLPSSNSTSAGADFWCSGRSRSKSRGDTTLRPCRRGHDGWPEARVWRKGSTCVLVHPTAVGPSSFGRRPVFPVLWPRTRDC